jgi:hypothetical protein
MTESPTPEDDQRPEPGDGDESHEPKRNESGPVSDAAAEALRSFGRLQRELAASNLAAIDAAQRMAASIPKNILSGISDTQLAMAQNIARSVDFNRLQQMSAAILANAPLARDAEALQRQWAQLVAQALDPSSLRRASEAFLANINFDRIGEAHRAVAATLTTYFDSKTFQDSLRYLTIDAQHLLRRLDDWIPANLRGADLEEAAAMALDDGIPVVWIPRRDIVEALVAAKAPDARADVLDGRHGEILDDCELALREIGHEWAHQCRAAIAALRAEFDGPAQSHAANIVDSIVLRILGREGRDSARTRAQEALDDLPLQVAIESLVLRPLFKALTSWWPNTGTPPPEHFARHPTAHAVGEPGLFQRRHALVAVMLATSLTVQFWGEAT